MPRAATAIGRGFQTARDLAFGPDGDLYVSEFAQDRILRIASPPSAGVIVKADDGRGGTATQSYNILVRPEPGNFPPAIVSQPSTSVLILPPPAGRNRLAITFEGIPAPPTFSQSNPIPPEARLSDRFLPTTVDLRSASGVPHIAVIRLGAGHAHSGTNGIGGMSSATALSYVTPILANSSSPMTRPPRHRPILCPSRRIPTGSMGQSSWMATTSMVCCCDDIGHRLQWANAHPVYAWYPFGEDSRHHDDGFR